MYKQLSDTIQEVEMIRLCTTLILFVFVSTTQKLFLKNIYRCDRAQASKGLLVLVGDVVSTRLLLILKTSILRH